MGYGYIEDMRAEVEVPQGGILSRVVADEGGVSLTLFAFDAGQSLSRHTAVRPAIVEVLEGEAEIDLGEDTHAARPGTWVLMPAGLPHAIRAIAPLKLALTLLPPEPGRG
jgi:quercetin dioxygenase-like cupin family protein